VSRASSVSEASLRVAGGYELEREREGRRRGLSAGPLGRFLLYVLRLRSFGFINVLLLYDMRRVNIMFRYPLLTFFLFMSFVAIGGYTPYCHPALHLRP
jgi:hypothetical protein